jgi:hypothetical protein
MSEENTGGDGQNGAILNDPVDVIIDKLLRYDWMLDAAAVPLREGLGLPTESCCVRAAKKT